MSRRTFFPVFSTQLALWCGDSAEVVSRTSPTHPETPWLEDEGSILLGWHMFTGDYMLHVSFRKCMVVECLIKIDFSSFLLFFFYLLRHPILIVSKINIKLQDRTSVKCWNTKEKHQLPLDSLMSIFGQIPCK